MVLPGALDHGGVKVMKPVSAAKKIISTTRALLFAASATFLFSVSACSFGFPNTLLNTNSANARWTNPEASFKQLGTIYDGPDPYYFLLFSDIHFGKKNGPAENTLLDFIDYHNQKVANGEVHEDANAATPYRFCLFLGDAAEHGDEEEFKEYAQFEKKVIEKMKEGDAACFGRILAVLGNHDTYSKGYGYWQEYTFPGTPGFLFTTVSGGKSRSFYGTDSASSCFGSNQLNFLEKKFTSDSNPKFFLSHEPYSQLEPHGKSFMVSFDQEEKLMMMQLLFENNFDAFLSGHVHTGGITVRDETVDYTVKSFTNNGGEHSFYTVKIDEQNKKATIYKFTEETWKSGHQSSYTIALK